MAKYYKKKNKKGYKGNTRGYSKGAYRPRFISREIQLLNRRPQMLTQKCVHQESFYLSQPNPSGPGVFSILQMRCAFPGNPSFWGTTHGTLMYPQTLTQTETTLFSQMGAMYKEAYVIGAKMEVHVKFVGRRIVGSEQINNPSQQENLVALGIVNSGVTHQNSPDNDLDVQESPSSFQEKNNFRVARVMVAGNSNDGGNLQGATNLRTKDIKLTAYYSPKKLLGIKDVGDHEACRFPLDAGSQQYLPNNENPQFVLAIGHNCDNTSTALPIVRGTHNDCYITTKTTYIVKCVEPTDVRGSNLIISTGNQSIGGGIRHDEL